VTLGTVGRLGPKTDGPARGRSENRLNKTQLISFSHKFIPLNP
jgi:hypothetical protein